MKLKGSSAVQIVCMGVSCVLYCLSIFLGMDYAYGYAGTEVLIAALLCMFAPLTFIPLLENGWYIQKGTAYASLEGRRIKRLYDCTRNRGRIVLSEANLVKVDEIVISTPEGEATIDASHSKFLPNEEFLSEAAWAKDGGFSLQDLLTMSGCRLVRLERRVHG